MPVRCGRQVLLVCVVVGLVTSCGQHKKKSEIYYTGWIPPGNVPPALEEIGATAVNIIDLAASDAWPQVYAYVQSISDLWSDYKHPTVVPPSYPRPTEGLLYGRLDTALGRLKAAAAARNATETMRAANDVDAATIELIEFYAPSVPPDLHRLAVLERKVMLDSWDGRLDAASDTLIEVRRTWSQARPRVVTRASEPVAVTFDSTLADQQAAIDAGEVIRLGDYAKTSLIMIHEMQQLSY